MKGMFIIAKNARQTAFDTLMRVFYDGAYSNIAIDKAIKENALDKVNASFAAALLYGVLENGILLDYQIGRFIKKGVKSLDKEVLTIIRLGFYQILFMDGVPDSAAVDESVRLCSYAKKTSARGLVNAVLRSFLRDNKKTELPIIKSDRDKIEHYSVKHSCPRWLIEMWSKQYDLDTAVKLAEAAIGQPPIYIRVNTLKTTSDKLIGYLENKGVSARKHDWLEDCLIVEKTGAIDKLAQFKQGLFHVQDLSSQLCVRAIGAEAGHTVLDICSAPGSKSFTLAEYMNNLGEIYSYDVLEHKLKLINTGAKRLGISIINTQLQDGSCFNSEIKKADRVLCDVPCSGLGIIRRKPEIKYKSMQDISGLPEIQYKILQNASRYVKQGGYLFYSTCTINKNENDSVVNKFLSVNNSFKPLQLDKFLDKIKGTDNFCVTLLPYENNSDGFFIAGFECVNDG